MNQEQDAFADMDPHFFSIVLSLSSAAMQQLGKIPNSNTQKVERNLMQAQMTIDMLVMLKNKTLGNLSVKENQLLKNTISDLQLNYADEAVKGETTVEKNDENLDKNKPLTE